MDIEKEILKNYKSKYQFAKENGLSPQNVQYWCNKGYENLRLDTKFKLDGLLLQTK